MRQPGSDAREILPLIGAVIGVILAVQTGAAAGYPNVSLLPVPGWMETIAWPLGGAIAGFMLLLGFNDACTRRHGTGWLGSPWSGRKQYFAISAGCAVIGYVVSAARYPDYPDFTFLAAWYSAGSGAFVAAVLKQQADEPARSRYAQRVAQRRKLEYEMETFAEYLARSLGRRGLWLTCSGAGFDAADYRWWAANDADYGWTADRRTDELIAGNWCIKYDDGDIVRTEFAGRSEEIRPKGIAEPEYFRSVRLSPEPPSDYELAERLHRFLEVRRSWEIPTRPGSDGADLVAVAARITSVLRVDLAT